MADRGRTKSRPQNKSSRRRQRLAAVAMKSWLMFGQSTYPARSAMAFSRQQSNRRRSVSRNMAATSEQDHSSAAAGLVLPSFPDLKIRNVMAPMVAASDYPFRYFLRKHCGVDLVHTQMLHSKNFCTDPKFRRSHLDLYEAGAQYDEWIPSQLSCIGSQSTITTKDHDRAPLVVQLAGHQVDFVVKSALMIMEHTDGGVAGFDLNCGCPQAIARKGRYGAFLMEEDDKVVCKILSALRDALPSSVAVSAKIRLPLDDETIQDRIPRLVDTGINFMTIHGRTLLENKTKVGAVHTDRMKLAIDIARKVDASFPVVANGGMETYDDVQTIMKETGAVAAMSSEALLETPNIFMPESSSPMTPKERMEQQFHFAREYMNICSTVAPPLPGVLGASKHKGGSFNVARGHLYKFLHRYIQEHPDIRDCLAGERTMTSIPKAQAVVEELYERYSALSDDDWDDLKSSSAESSWYRRHRKPGREVHQKEIRIASNLITTVKEESLEERKKRMKQRIQSLRLQNKERAINKPKRFIS